MKRLTVRMEIGRYQFPFVSEIEVLSSWENLTDTASIRVPRKLQFEGLPLGEKAFHRGDAVRIWAGYDFAYQELFSGYVSRFEPGTPLVFHCEDAAYLLKRKAIAGYSRQKVSLRQLLTEICPIDFECVDADLGAFRIAGNATTAQVLDELKKAYSLYSFVRSGKLHVGLPYTAQNPNRLVLDMNRNVADSSGLEYQYAEDVHVKIIMVSLQPDNKKITYPYGDLDGQTRTLHFYNRSLDWLKQQAKAELRKLKFDGCAGSVLAFGEPFVRHGDAIQIVDRHRPEREGTYLVKAVTYTVGMGGFRQEITLDQKKE